MKRDHNSSTFYIIIKNEKGETFKYPRAREEFIPVGFEKVKEAENPDQTLKSEFRNTLRFYQKYGDRFVRDLIFRIGESNVREDNFKKKTNKELAKNLFESKIYNERELFTYESDLLEAIYERLKEFV